jgi:hypothetical protein
MGCLKHTAMNNAKRVLIIDVFDFNLCECVLHYSFLFTHVGLVASVPVFYADTPLSLLIRRIV